MNRECRNCVECKLDNEPGGKWFWCNRWCLKVDGHVLPCRYWRAYTEKERETTIPADAAMVSVPWDWVRRIEKLEGTVEFHDKRTHEHRDGGLLDRVQTMEDVIETLERHNKALISMTSDLRQQVAKLESEGVPVEHMRKGLKKKILARLESLEAFEKKHTMVVTEWMPAGPVVETVSDLAVRIGKLEKWRRRLSNAAGKLVE